MSREWRVRLDGDTFDLEDLPEWFQGQEMRVAKLSDGYYLTSSVFDDLESAEAVHQKSRQLLESLVGIAKLHRPDLGPVSISVVAQDSPGGAKFFALELRGSLRMRSKVSAHLSTDRTGAPDVPRATIWARLAERDTAVAQALRLWGSASTWVDLYRVFEVIESHASGGLSAWATKAQLSRFAQTANSMAAIGDAARHARGGTPAPRSPMTLGEAKALVHGLLEAWIKSKA